MLIRQVCEVLREIVEVLRRLTGGYGTTCPTDRHCLARDDGEACTHAYTACQRTMGQVDLHGQPVLYKR